MGRMLGRMLIAIVGGLIVTAGILLAMDAVTGLFRERDLQRYFRITDILPKPDPGRPERPEALDRLPANPGNELMRSGPVLPLEVPSAAPSLPVAPIDPPTVAAPRLEPEPEDSASAR